MAIMLEEFLRKAIQKYGSKFDYSKVVYEKDNKQIEIICPIHGSFMQKPIFHLSSKHGCQLCSRIEGTNKWRTSKTQLLEEAALVHENKYDYSKVLYTSKHKKVEIICPTHGSFWTLINAHIKKSVGCPVCTDTFKILESTFIYRAKAKYGDRFTYDNLGYTTFTNPIHIICKEHGSFSTTPRNHLHTSSGCVWCHKRQSTRETFMERCRILYNDYYDYSKTVCKNYNSIVEVICPKHGSFSVKAERHLNGKRCPVCVPSRQITLENFLKRCRDKHRDSFDYSKVIYKNTFTPVEIICLKHGSFMQKPEHHYSQKSPCPKCKLGDKDISTFIATASDKFNHKFDYTKVSYKDYFKDKVIIECPKHGEQSIVPNAHLSSDYGCRECGYEGLSVSKSNTQETFLEKARLVHGDKYDYSRTHYERGSEKVIILCNKHGEFQQTASNHLAGQGCPSCPAIVSKPHKVLIDFIKSRGLLEGVDFFINDRKSIKASSSKSLELDIFFPKHQFAIEVNGVFWHSIHKGEDRLKHKDAHLNKLLSCQGEGIRLMQFTDLEILEKTFLVTSIISTALGISSKIFARTCTIKELSREEAAEFLRENHLQGGTPSSVRLGLYNREGVLVQLLTFGKPRYNSKYHWELLRACTKANLIVIGGMNRLFKYFLTKYAAQKGVRILSYCDKRIFQGTLYKKLGFTLVRETSPNYVYLYRGSKVVGSRLKFQKHKLAKFLGDAFDNNKTEIDNMLDNGYTILYDCGNSVWEYLT